MTKLPGLATLQLVMVDQMKKNMMIGRGETGNSHKKCWVENELK